MALSRKPQEIVEDSKNPLLSKHESWDRVPVGDIADILNGFAFKSSKFTNDKGMPLIRIRDVGKDSSETFYDGEYDKTYLVNDGDLLVGMDGDFRAAIWKGGKALLNQRVCKISLKTDDYDFKFLSYVLQPYLNAIHAETSSVTVKHLSSRSISEIPLPLPPKEQQKRIVAKIEELFSHIDAGIAALKKAKQLLKQYRQSVLKAAVTGELTKEWREANKDKLEPASQLLERIFKERREKWEEQQLEQFKAKDKVPKDAKWKEKYKEPVKIEHATDLYDLPSGWEWVYLDSLIVDGPQNGLYLPQTKYGSGVPIIRIDDFQDGYVRPYDELQKVNASEPEIETYSLRSGDLVINRVNSPTHLGKCIIVREKYEACLFESNMMKAEISSNVSAKYLDYYIQSKYGRSKLIKNAKWAVNQASINQQDVKNTEITLPSIDEQNEIVRLVIDKIESHERLNSEIDFQLIKSEKNKQSILASAFCGKLSNKNNGAKDGLYEEAVAI